jgi:hypothetical protein
MKNRVGLLDCGCIVSSAQVSDELLEKWLRLLDVALSYHSESAEICGSCCQFLSKLLASYDGPNSLIGDQQNQ